HKLYQHSFPTRRSSDLVVNPLHGDQYKAMIASIRGIENESEQKEARVKHLPFFSMSNFIDGKRDKELFQNAIGLMIDVDGLAIRYEEHTSELQSRRDLV